MNNVVGIFYATLILLWARRATLVRLSLPAFIGLVIARAASSANIYFADLSIIFSAGAIVFITASAWEDSFLQWRKIGTLEWMLAQGLTVRQLWLGIAMGIALYSLLFSIMTSIVFVSSVHPNSNEALQVMLHNIVLGIWGSFAMSLLMTSLGFISKRVSYLQIIPNLAFFIIVFSAQYLQYLLGSNVLWAFIIVFLLLLISSIVLYRIIDKERLITAIE